MTDVHALLAEFPLVPVIQIDRFDRAVPLVEALFAAGIGIAEVTLRSDQAIKAIEQIAKHLPHMRLAAGTVLTPEQADRAMAAGAEMLVSPGLNPTMVEHCQRQGYPFIPGVNNPSQIEQALQMGVNLLKFFPAEASGGVTMLKALLAPYQQVSFMPTGGISADNLLSYLALDRVVACGGSWMVAPKLVANQEWQTITELSQQAMDLVHNRG